MALDRDVGSREEIAGSLPVEREFEATGHLGDVTALRTRWRDAMARVLLPADRA